MTDRRAARDAFFLNVAKWVAGRANLDPKKALAYLNYESTPEGEAPPSECGAATLGGRHAEMCAARGEAPRAAGEVAPKRKAKR